MRAERPDAGFTLVEVVVAFVVAASCSRGGDAVCLVAPLMAVRGPNACRLR